jgi:hypothetical protein
MMKPCTLLCGALITIALATPAAAQICGDANDNGTVTVTDGVQALRAAADLSSTCEDGCDVDGSGAITVSDGVNILRKAAGLSINETCEFTAQEANGVVNPSLSIFDAITKVPGVGASSALIAAGDCDNDGTVERVDIRTSSAATFTNCQIGNAILDGTISRAVLGSGVVIGFDGFKITRMKTGKSLTFNGQLGITSENAGKRLAGNLSITRSEGDSFTITFQRILLTGDGSVIQGQLIYDLTKLTTGKIAAIQITFGELGDGSVRVLLRNQQVRQFLLDPDTRLLIPAV